MKTSNTKRLNCTSKVRQKTFGVRFNFSISRFFTIHMFLATGYPPIAIVSEIPDEFIQVILIKTISHFAKNQDVRIRRIFAGSAYKALICTERIF